MHPISIRSNCIHLISCVYIKNLTRCNLCGLYNHQNVKMFYRSEFEFSLAKKVQSPSMH